MSSLERLPQNRLVGAVRELATNALEAKGAQPYGSDALVTQRVFSDQPYDLQANGTRRRIRVEFTPNDLTFGGAPVFKMKVRLMNTSNVVILPISFDVERQRPEGNKQVWLVFVWVDSSSPFRLKFFFDSVGSGVFSATVLN